jgi:kinetochore protein Mis12/MTW1
VKDVVDTAGRTFIFLTALVANGVSVAPLPQTAADIARTLRNLHAKLDTIDPGPPVPPAPVAAGTHAQAWELGRQAYLNWATQKLVSSTKVEGGPEQLDEIPAGQDVEALAAGLARGA